jgi:PmbA protein
VAALEKTIMTNLAENTVKTALQKGAVDSEAYVYEGQATNIGIELGQISKTNRIIDRGLGIRVFLGQATGFAYTNIVNDPQAIENVVESAISIAKASKPDPDWKELPKKKPYINTEKTFDKRIVELSSEELVAIATIMLDAAKQADKRVFPIEGGVGSAYASNVIANSNGVIGFDSGTMIECSLVTLAKEEGAVTPACFEFSVSREYNLDPAWVGKEAARLAVSALKPQPVETKPTRVIFNQVALQDLFASTLINAIRADSLQRGQSPFKGRINERVASEKLTIIDDGLIPGGIRTSRFDGEGTPHQKTSVIEKGVLKSFLYDNYTANKCGKESTGNAARAGYLSTPSIDTTNFHILPENKTSEQIIRETDNGLIVYSLQGAHSSNPISGEFSVVATPAWKIENGEITQSSRSVMLAGNMFEALNNISLVGNNERQVGSLIAPWIMIENLRVIGK